MGHFCYPLAPSMPYLIKNNRFMFFSVCFLSLVWYGSKEYTFIPHSHLIPYPYSLPRFYETLHVLPLIPQINSNGIVLAQSFCLLRQCNSLSKCMRICYYCNTNTASASTYINIYVAYTSRTTATVSEIPIFDKLFWYPDSDSVLSTQCGHRRCYAAAS